MKLPWRELNSEARRRQGYVLVLPGVEGRSPFNRNLVRGLLAAGVPFAIEIHDWTCGFTRLLYNLMSERLHQQQAETIAGKIKEYRAVHPDQPVYLIGHSGGGAIALMALERLPEEITVSAAVLLGCALSPGFPLQQAIARTERGVWNMSSFADLFIIGLGTLIFGTMDRRHSLSAGLCGFRRDGLDEATRRKLHEFPYRLKFLRTCHLAGHFGYTGRRFVKQYLAPLLLNDPSEPRHGAGPRGPSR